jgi:hypothetical protein
MTGHKLAQNLGGEIKEDGKVEKKKGNSTPPAATTKSWVEPNKEWTPPQ